MMQICKSILTETCRQENVPQYPKFCPIHHPRGTDSSHRPRSTPSSSSPCAQSRFGISSAGSNLFRTAFKKRAKGKRTVHVQSLSCVRQKSVAFGAGHSTDVHSVHGCAVKPSLPVTVPKRTKAVKSMYTADEFVLSAAAR